MAKRPVATILIPTHDHAQTLPFSARSALDQSVHEIELFIVGDGVGDDTRSVVRELEQADERVCFFDYPKGPRRGEVNRHAALQEAQGRVVCYLSDDDLYLPNHVELMLEALEDADFGCSLPMAIRPGGDVHVSSIDLALPYFRSTLQAGSSRISLTNGAHTLALYRRLPYGWRTTPEGTYPDLYMWQQLLSVDGVRAVTTSVCTTLQYPSSLWMDLSWNERRAAIEDGFNRRRELAGSHLWLSALRFAARQWAQHEAHCAYERALHEASWSSQLKQAHEERAALAVRMRSMRRSVFWQARERLLATPVVGAIGPRVLATIRRKR